MLFYKLPLMDSLQHPIHPIEVIALMSLILLRQFAQHITQTGQCASPEWVTVVIFTL
jgi:hypothetical protein